MLRCPLERIVLQAKLLDMGPPKAVLAYALDPPNLTNIERTILILKEVSYFNTSLFIDLNIKLILPRTIDPF